MNAPEKSIQTPPTETSQEDEKVLIVGRSLFFAVLFLVALIAIAATGFGVNLIDNQYSNNPDILLTILVLGGTLTLLGMLGFTAMAFAALGLTDKEKALALPEGSVRALIALLLIVLFSILSILLYRQLRLAPEAEILVYKNKDAEQVKAIVQSYSEEEVLEVLESPKGVFSIRVRVERDTTESQRFAQQVLTTISTLVVAVAGFYFGTRAVTTAGDIALKSAGMASKERSEILAYKQEQENAARAATIAAQETVTKAEEAKVEAKKAEGTLQKKVDAINTADQQLFKARQVLNEAEIAIREREQAKIELEAATTDDERKKAEKRYQKAVEKEKLARRAAEKAMPAYEDALKAAALAQREYEEAQATQETLQQESQALQAEALKAQGAKEISEKIIKKTTGGL